MGIYTEAVQKLYVAYFSRPADTAGLAYWESVVTAANGNTSAVSAAFAASAEYKATYGSLDEYHVVDAVYMNLFGRHAEPAGLQFWGQNLISHTLTIDAIVTQIAGGANGADLDAYQNKVTAATAFTAALDTSAEILDYNTTSNPAAKLFLAGVTDDASLAALLVPATFDAAVKIVTDTGMPAPVVVNVELTKGIDSLVGGAGNDSFTAVDLEWSSLDKVDGGAGVNTFTVAQTAPIAFAPAGATVTNITDLNLISGGAITVDATTFGVKTINVTAGGTSSITANDTTDVKELTSTHSSSITGGKNVTIVNTGTNTVHSEGAAGNVDITSKSAGAFVEVVDAAGDVKVTAKGGTFIFWNTQVDADGATLDVSISNAVSRADQVAHITAASNASDALNDANDAATAASGLAANLTTLKAFVTGALTARTEASFTLAAYVSGDITRDQKIAIDAAFAASLAATDLPTAQTTAAALLTASITAASAASAAADLAVLSATAALSAANTVVSNDTNAGAADVGDNLSTTLTKATITGNYNGSVSLSDGSTLSNTLTKVTLDHAGNATLVGNALTDITISNTNKMVSVTNTTANHTDSLTLSAITTGTSGFQDNFAGTLNIASNGTATNRLDTFNATSATAVNITGAAGFGASMANVGTDAVITATASTGANQISDLGAGQSYLGGSGNDTVTVSGTTAQAVKVDGGAGSADRLNVSNGVNIAANATTGAVNFSGFEILGVTGISADVRDFTNSTFTSVSVAGVAGGAAGVTGLNATQAAAITVTADTLLTVGVVGATTVGQLDTVKINASSATAGVNLGAVTLAGVETLNLSANAHSGTTADLHLATALTAVNVDGSGDLNLTTGVLALNVNTVIDAHAVAGDVYIDASAATTNGLKIIGSAVGSNFIQVNGATSFANVIVGGDRGDYLIGGAGSDTITSGNGNNTIDAGAGNNTIVSGNGFSTINSGAGNDKITVGTGGNVIDSGAGADKIVLGAHVAGVVNDIYLATAAATVGANMDTITGFVSGQDHLVIADGTALTGTLTVDAATSSIATMLATVTSATLVADTAAVYTALATALNGTVGHEYAVSTAGSLVAREVTFTTGAAAGTYLVINDDTAGFNGNGDIVVKLVGGTTVTAADIIVM
jgi:hypothetical protein